MEHIKKRFDRHDIAFVILLFIGLAFICWKARFGSADRDESFYLTIMYRFWQGDAIYYDEVNGAQTFAFLIYPIMCLFMAINKSTEGMVLFFRYVFVLFQLLVSILIYCRFKEYSKTGSLLASIVFLIFAPFNEMALYYNTLGMITLVVSLTLLLTYKNDLDLFVGGVFFAANVLCHPYGAVTYFVWSIAVFIAFFMKKEREYLSLRVWARFTFGIVFLAIVFIVFVFTKITIKNFIDFLPYTGDESHYLRPLHIIVSTHFNAVFAFTNYTLYLYICLALVLVAYFIDKNRSKHRPFYYFSFIGIGILLLFFVFVADQHLNFIMFPLNVVGLACAVISEKKEVKDIALVYSVPAYIYTFYIHASSNVGGSVICSSSVVCLVSCLVIICSVYEEVMEEFTSKKFIRVVMGLELAFLMIFQIGLEGYLRYVDCFPEPLVLQDTLIDYGPCKGIIEEGVEKTIYDKTMGLLEYVKNKYPQRKIMFSGFPTWIYVAAEEYDNCSTSSWNVMHLSLFVDLADFYYSSNSQKIPEIIVAGYDLVDDPAIEKLAIYNQYNMAEEYMGYKIYLHK